MGQIAPFISKKTIDKGKNKNLGGEIHPDFLCILPIDKLAARPRSRRAKFYYTTPASILSSKKCEKIEQNIYPEIVHLFL